MPARPSSRSGRRRAARFRWRDVLRTGPGRRRSFFSAAIAALVLLALTTTTSQGAFTAGVQNTGNRVGTGAVSVTATAGGTTLCSTAPTAGRVVAAATTACTETGAVLGPQTPGGAVSTTTVARATTLTAAGTVSPSTGSFAATGCAPAAFANPVVPSTPMLPRGGVTFAAAGPLSGGGAMTVDGSTGLATAVTANVATAAALTFGISFRAAPGSPGGVLISLDASAAQVTANATNRVIWLDGNGNLNAGAYDTTTVRRTVSSAGVDYRDGAWHQVVFVVSPGVLGAVLSNWRLYVDGVSRQTGANLLAAPPAASGYWHAGWGDVTTGTPTWASTGSGTAVNHFTGSLANAFATNAVLEQSTLVGLYGQTTQAGWLAATAGFTTTWPLGDDGRTPFDGALPGGARPCSWVDVTVDDTAPASCVYPAAGAACPAPGPTYRLSTLVAAGTLPLLPATLTTPQVVTFSLARDASYLTTFGVGLHLLVPVQMMQATGSFGYTLTWTAYRFVI